jgi:hypothetical protein
MTIHFLYVHILVKINRRFCWRLRTAPIYCHLLPKKCRDLYLPNFIPTLTRTLLISHVTAPKYCVILLLINLFS